MFFGRRENHAFLPATGGGARGVFYVIFGYPPKRLRNRQARLRSVHGIADDLQSLRAGGYDVVVDCGGTLDALREALTGRHPAAKGRPAAGVYWNGHGNTQGSLQDVEDGFVRPKDLDVPPCPTLKLFVFASCYTGASRDLWQAALGEGVHLHGWGEGLTWKEKVAFLAPDAQSKHDLDDLIAKHLDVKRLADAPGEEEVKAMLGLDMMETHVHADPLERRLRPPRMGEGDVVLAQKYHTGDYYEATVLAIESRVAKVKWAHGTDPATWVGLHQLRALTVDEDVVDALIGCRVNAKWSDGKFYCGAILRKQGERYEVKFAGTDGPPLMVAAEHIRPYGELTPRLGQAVRVSRGGVEDDVHPARLVETDGNRFLAKWEDGAEPEWIDTWDVER